MLVLVALTLVNSISWGDPPGRVGRISYTQGQVSLCDTYGDQSSAVALNWPLTSQNVIATAPGARAEVQVGSATVRVGPDSELEIAQLDDDRFTLLLIQGSVAVRIKSREQVQDFKLGTPQGWVLLTEPSRIRVDAERAPDTTTLSVFAGASRFDGAGSSVMVHAGTRAEIVGGTIRMTDARSHEDDFDAWSLERDRRDDQIAAPRYVSPELTGYEDLDTYGTWSMTESYGAVWYPTVVTADWAPYRHGRWAWIAPWGWTWVDSAPWGFAPFHYGRWVWFHRRWCWAPGRVVARPVWAPALVGWIGGSNWNVRFPFGAAPAVGWFPLAPHEVFVPSYRVSPAYLRQVNITHVANITNVTIINGVASAPPRANFHNRFVHNAVTVAPQDQFRTGRPVVISAVPRAVVDQPSLLQTAPVSATVPARIARISPRGVRPDATPPLAAPRMRQGNRQPGVASAPASAPIQPAAPNRQLRAAPRMEPQRAPMATGVRPLTIEPGAPRQPNVIEKRHAAPPRPSAPVLTAPSPHAQAVPERPAAPVSTPKPTPPVTNAARAPQGAAAQERAQARTEARSQAMEQRLGQAFPRADRPEVAQPVPRAMPHEAVGPRMAPQMQRREVPQREAGGERPARQNHGTGRGAGAESRAIGRAEGR